MKPLDTPNKKIIIDNKPTSNSTVENKKIRIEMTCEEARELLDKPESNRTIVLPNGSKVCITESGDPNGTPAIMMSGLSMHSRKYALLLNNYGLRYKVKIIGFDRPNIDGSDPIYFKESKKKSSKKFKKIYKKHSKSSKTSKGSETSKNTKISKSSKTSVVSSHSSDVTLTAEDVVDNNHIANDNNQIHNNEKCYENENNNEKEKEHENENENENENKNEKEHENENESKDENEDEKEKENNLNSKTEEGIPQNEDENVIDIKSNNNNNDNNNDKDDDKDKDKDTKKLKKGEVDLRVYAEWVEAIIDTLNIKRCHLISLCLGGLYVVGCVKYFKHPEKIASPLYLIAPWASPKKCVYPIRFVNTFIPTPVIRTAMSCYFKTVGLFVPNAIKHPNALMFKVLHVDEKCDPLGGRRLLFSQVLKSGFFRTGNKHICHDDWELCFRVNPNNKIDFSTINKDVIIYHGTKDKLIPAKSSKYLVKKWNPNFKAELHIKKGKDHSTIKGSCLHDIFRSIVANTYNNTEMN